VKTKDLEVLTEYVRNALRRTICGQYAVADPSTGRPKLTCVTLDPALESLISGYIDRGPAGTTLTMPARIASQIADQISRAAGLVLQTGNAPVVIASPQVRGVVRQIIEGAMPTAAVLGYNEIVNGVDVESLALVMPPDGAVDSAGLKMAAA
jgi:flagellar biosynthesis protein FlhA